MRSPTLPRGDHFGGHSGGRAEDSKLRHFNALRPQGALPTTFLRLSCPPRISRKLAATKLAIDAGSIRLSCLSPAARARYYRLTTLGEGVRALALRRLRENLVVTMY